MVPYDMIMIEYDYMIMSKKFSAMIKRQI